jgi:hypothetical protein
MRALYKKTPNFKEMHGVMAFNAIRIIKRENIKDHDPRRKKKKYNGVTGIVQGNSINC